MTNCYACGRKPLFFRSAKPFKYWVRCQCGKSTTIFLTAAEAEKSWEFWNSKTELDEVTVDRSPRITLDKYLGKEVR